MPAFPAKTFRAALEPSGDELRWIIARVPFDIKTAWPAHTSRRVRGDINGFAFRTALFPNSRDGGYSLLVNKKMQAGARAQAGDKVTIRLEPDTEDRATQVPPELTRALKSERGLRKWFDSLNPSMRRWLGYWVAEPKSPSSRLRRAEQCAEWLLLTKEGEEETPPILRAAFQCYPGAAAAWEAMSVARRRNHLLSVFHCQTPETRRRRVQYVLQDTLKFARKLGPHDAETTDFQ